MLRKGDGGGATYAREGSRNQNDGCIHCITPGDECT
jgi:hypothetical protein